MYEEEAGVMRRYKYEAGGGLVRRSRVDASIKGIATRGLSGTESGILKLAGA